MNPTVLFDLDGTLTNPAVGIVACLQHALRKLGHHHFEDAALRRFIGPPLHLGFAELLATTDSELVQQGVAFYRERFSTVGLYENEVYPDIPGLLSHLCERHVRLFVATSKPTVYSERIIEHFGLAPYFERVYGSELTGERTNKAELLRYILDEQGLDAQHTFMVGDRSHDVVGALACDMACFGVTWGFGSREELTESGAHLVVETVAELRLALAERTSPSYPSAEGAIFGSRAGGGRR